MPAATLCDRYEQATAAESASAPGFYFAIATGCEELPRAVNRDDRTVTHGYAVRTGAQWSFFTGREPAMVFGRAARMGATCSSYSVHRAASEVRFCSRHGQDERVLHIEDDRIDRQPDEATDLERFAAGVKARPDSSHWHPPRPVSAG